MEELTPEDDDDDILSDVDEWGRDESDFLVTVHDDDRKRWPKVTKDWKDGIPLFIFEIVVIDGGIMMNHHPQEAIVGDDRLKKGEVLTDLGYDFPDFDMRKTKPDKIAELLEKTTSWIDTIPARLGVGYHVIESGKLQSSLSKRLNTVLGLIE